MNLPWLNQSYGSYPQYGGYGSPMPWDYAGMQRAQDSYNPLGSLIKSGAAAQYNLQGTDLGPMQDIASQISALGKASYDPNDPLYQKLYTAERGSAQQDLATAIAEMGRQNRKLSSMGRTPLFDPERGGEQVFRQLAQGYTSAEDNARQRARQIIGAGQNAMGQAYNAYGTLSSAQDQNKKKKAFGLSNIADLIPVLRKRF